MNRILLLLENKRNRDLLAQWLATHYEVLQSEAARPLNLSFDLCVLDGTMLERIWPQVQARKAAEQPLFLPFILISSQQETTLVTRHLWKTADELIRLPIEKMELQARVEMLLRTRRLSLDLKLRNEDLESFIYAMTHDLRAPLRAVQGFTDALAEDEGDRLSATGTHYLATIQQASKQMQEIIDALLGFSRIGREDIQMQQVEVHLVLEDILSSLQQDIQLKNAHITFTNTSCGVWANPTLLKMAFTNLLSNALKFVGQGIQPIIAISAQVVQNRCRIEVQDNGIGISAQDQKRLFAPFVQLHGVETYAGIGLGLATVRKAAELMGGDVGVKDGPGGGSIFWLELLAIDEVQHALSCD